MPRLAINAALAIGGEFISSLWSEDNFDARRAVLWFALFCAVDFAMKA